MYSRKLFFSCLVKKSVKVSFHNFRTVVRASLILREINFGDFRMSKTVTLTILELLKWAKWQFLGLHKDQNWFHIKFEWQKNPEISTLCMVYLLTIQCLT